MPSALPVPWGQGPSVTQPAAGALVKQEPSAPFVSGGASTAAPGSRRVCRAGTIRPAAAPKEPPSPIPTTFPRRFPPTSHVSASVGDFGTGQDRLSGRRPGIGFGHFGPSIRSGRNVGAVSASLLSALARVPFSVIASRGGGPGLSPTFPVNFPMESHRLRLRVCRATASRRRCLRRSLTISGAGIKTPPEFKSWGSRC